MPIKKQKRGASELNRQSAIGNRQSVEVSAGLIFYKGKLLITQRHDGAHLGGLWEFPGGKREAGETFEQCLVRELREELGVEIVVGELLETIQHTYPEKTVRLKFFKCKLASGKPRPLGCAALQWVDRSDLKNYKFPAADEQLLEKLQNAAIWQQSFPAGFKSRTDFLLYER